MFLRHPIEPKVRGYSAKGSRTYLLDTGTGIREIT
jgi:hypothetical protein